MGAVLSKTFATSKWFISGLLYIPVWALSPIWRRLLGRDSGSSICVANPPSTHHSESTGQSFRKFGPCEFNDLEIDTPEKINNVLEMCKAGCPCEEVTNHLRACLKQASDNNQEMCTTTVVHSQKRGILRNDSYSYRCDVKVSKGPINHTSKIELLSSDDVFKIISSFSGGAWRTEWKTHAYTFRRNGVDGKTLKELTHDHMHDLGVHDGLHRLRLDVEIKALTEAKSVQSFNVVIAVGGVSAQSNTKSKDDVKDMLEAEFNCPSVLNVTQPRALGDVMSEDSVSQDLSSWDRPASE